MLPIEHPRETIYGHQIVERYFSHSTVLLTRWARDLGDLRVSGGGGGGAAWWPSEGSEIVARYEFDKKVAPARDALDL